MSCCELEARASLHLRMVRYDTVDIVMYYNLGYRDTYRHAYDT